MKTTKPATAEQDVTLSAEDQKRLQKLKELKERLESGKHVQNKTLKIWLQTKEFEEIEIRYGMQHEISDYYSAKPSEIQEYESDIKRAQFEYNKGEHFSRTQKHKAARARHNAAQNLYERSLSKLRDSITQDPSLESWIDRNVFDESISLSPMGIPMVRTSRSTDNQSKIGKKSKSEIKIDVINDAMIRINSGQISSASNESATEEQENEMLKSLMKSLLGKNKVKTKK